MRPKDGMSVTVEHERFSDLTLSPVERLELHGGKTPNMGNIFVNGQPVCDDYADRDNNAAMVVCR